MKILRNRGYIYPLLNEDANVGPPLKGGEEDSCLELPSLGLSMLSPHLSLSHSALPLEAGEKSHLRRAERSPCLRGGVWLLGGKYVAPSKVKSDPIGG